VNLEDLRERRRREREQDSLGRLPESFYRDAAGYIAELKQARERAAERADDPYGDPEVRRLTDELDAATDIVESLYERRVGKVVKLASFAAADMPHDDEGLTDEERALFDDLVGRIRDNRSRVLGALEGSADDGEAAAGGEAGSAEPAPTADAEAADPSPEPPDGGDDLGSPPAPDDPAGMLAEAMGDGPRVDGGGPDGRGETEPGGSEPGETTVSDPAPEETAERAEHDGGAPADPAAPERDGADDPTDGRTTVRITADVGEIYGVDDRSYRLEAEDVVSLPADNAAPLVEKDAAERL